MLISTKEKRRKENEKDYCVNALNRAMLISTEVKGNEKTSIGSVNALNRAMLISTNAYKVFCIIVALCVNALNRAMLISTLPFWNWLI